MKNVTLIDSYHNSKRTWKLLGPDGEPIVAFEVFAIALLRKYPFNTRSAYCRSVAAFIDYLFEAAAVLDAPLGALKRSELVAVIESFVDWLVAGASASSEIARAVAAVYPSPQSGASTRTQADHAQRFPGARRERGHPGYVAPTQRPGHRGRQDGRTLFSVVEGQPGMTTSLKAAVPALAARVQASCVALDGRTQGNCRQAAIILVELLLEAELVDWACVCQGRHGEHGHYWVRVLLGGEQWIVDPTVDQFDSAAPLLCRESASPAYREEAYLYFCREGLSRLRQHVRQ